jgi:5'-deoxynucleotidase YfbR-like HD superfamily hydrolase
MKKPNKNIKSLINLWSEADKLKKVIRFKDSPKITKKESSADHAWRTTFFIVTCFETIKPKINLTKAFKMASLHNLYEIYTDNLDYILANQNNITKKDRQKAKIKAVKKIQDVLPNKETINLIKEFEKNETEEAKFVLAISKLETLDHLVNYGFKGYSHPELIPNCADSAVKASPKLLPILKEIKSRLKKEFKKGGVLWKKEYD